VVITPLQGEIRSPGRHRPIRPRRSIGLQDIIQSQGTLWPHQKVTIFPAPHFPLKNAKKLSLLAEKHPTRTTSLLRPSLDSEKGKEDIFRGVVFQVLTHQLKRTHKRIRVGMNLRRRKLCPSKNLMLESRKRKVETHIFKFHFVHCETVVQKM